MSKPILLDTGPLGMAAHPRPSREFAIWYRGLLRSGRLLLIPEIADYELRRNLILEGMVTSIDRLNQLKTALDYLPITTDIMLRAAEFWAEARKRGRPPASPKALDGDAILAAQAEQVDGIVATDNVKHLELFVEAANWESIA